MTQFLLFLSKKGQFAQSVEIITLLDNPTASIRHILGDAFLNVGEFLKAQDCFLQVGAALGRVNHVFILSHHSLLSQR